jgi:hypothetical protein
MNIETAEAYKWIQKLKMVGNIARKTSGTKRDSNTSRDPSSSSNCYQAVCVRVCLPDDASPSNSAKKTRAERCK